MVVAMPKLMVAGLGNITHPLTRHSLGHLIVDTLASRLGIPLKSASGGYIGTQDVMLGDFPVSLTLYKSKSFMNISGPSIASTFRKIIPGSPASLIVIHDSLSHRPCVLAPRLGGSANGHNGVKSIIAALGGEQGFHRFRVGIGRGDGDVADYVLGRLSKQEKEYWGTEYGDGMESVIKEITKISRR
ncbi:hypothetical protein EYR38_006461 [Pleurotus pulmonarius]|nr:hypothetical protein EYR38_006461 [Pleurotus pulmonarius]